MSLHPVKVTQSDDSQSLNLPKAFRYDINGLRAWAVVAVVLYHFGVPGFAGGFVGVDVFFVISGFLMTGIIISGLERGNFIFCCRLAVCCCGAGLVSEA